MLPVWPGIPEMYSLEGIMGYGIAVDEIGEVDLYRFGRSKQIFRGTRPNLKNPYVAFIGGSETFGKFVSTPFPTLVKRYLRMTCVNWGTPGAGPGFFLKDPVILEACSKAEICVVQVMNPVALSNRMYSVFPRRNMRLRGVSSALRSLFPDVNFEDFKYVSAMLRKLADEDAEAYKIVLDEQRSAWVARMDELLNDIETRKVLLWLAPLDPVKSGCLITEEMVNAVRKKVETVITIRIKSKCGANMAFNGAMRDSAWMTRSVHSEVSKELSQVLKEMLNIEQRVAAH